jgi:hypothetical protein
MPRPVLLTAVSGVEFMQKMYRTGGGHGRKRAHPPDPPWPPTIAQQIGEINPQGANELSASVRGATVNFGGKPKKLGYNHPRRRRSR